MSKNNKRQNSENNDDFLPQEEETIMENTSATPVVNTQQPIVKEAKQPETVKPVVVKAIEEKIVKVPFPTKKTPEQNKRKLFTHAKKRDGLVF